MNKRINFEDNTFILNNRIKMIANSIILDVDPDLFLEKTIEDMDFIDTSLAILLENLLQNEKLIDRSAQFYHLIDTDIKFTDILDAIHKSKGPISTTEFPLITEKIGNFRSHSLERQKLIRASIEILDDMPEDPNVVSSDELNALLKDFS